MSLPLHTGFETVWLISHLAASLSRARPVPLHVARTLSARALTASNALFALADLSRVLPGPIQIGPPCSSAWSAHESCIVQAAVALERNETEPAIAAVTALARPRLLTPAQAGQALNAISRLTGQGPSARDRCSSGNGGVAMARTASDTSASALSSPATRLERSSPHC